MNEKEVMCRCGIGDFEHPPGLHFKRLLERATVDDYIRQEGDAVVLTTLRQMRDRARAAGQATAAANYDAAMAAYRRGQAAITSTTAH